MTGHLSDKIQSSNSRQLKRKSSCGSKGMVVGLRRALPKGLVLLCLILLAAGCGPKGYIEGTAYRPDGQVPGAEELLVSVDGKTHVVVTRPDGTFRIGNIALGSRRVQVSFYDAASGERYQWEGAVQVGIQGVKITVELGGRLQGFDELVRAVWRQLVSGQWESAKKNLEAAAAYNPQGDDEAACFLAWGWYYLRSGESPQGAEECFEKAQRAGKEAEAMVGLAAVKAAAGGYREAADQLEQALRAEPALQLDYLELTTGDLQLALAGYYLQAGEEAKAVQIVREKAQNVSAKGQEVLDTLLLFLEG